MKHEAVPKRRAPLMRERIHLMRCPRCRGKLFMEPVIGGEDELTCLLCGWVEVPELVMASSVAESERRRGVDPHGSNWKS